MAKSIRFVVLFMLMAVAAAASPVGTLMLCDFEKESDADKFVVRESTPPSTCTITDGGALRVFLPKWQQGSLEWPSAVWSAARGLPREWRDYDVVSCDFRNVGSTECNVSLFINDITGKNFATNVVLKPGETKTARVRLEDAPEGFDRLQMDNLYLITTRPPQDILVEMDNIRLESDVIERLGPIKDSIDQLKKASRDVASELGGPLAEMESDHRDLSNRASRAANASELAKVRPGVIFLEKRVKRDLARAVPEARMRIAARKANPDAEFACGFASSMVKIFPHDVAFSCDTNQEASIEMAGNETESLQLVIYAFEKDLKGASVQVTPLTKNGKTGPTVEASPVGFVETKKPPYAVKYIGWHPDPILDFLKGYNIKEGELQPVWIRVTAPAGTPAGDYKAYITVKALNAQPVKLGLNVKVWDFDVPQERHLRTAMSLYDVYLPYAYGQLTEPMRERYEDFVLSYRINPDNIYRKEMPPIESLKRWDKKGLNAFNILYVQKPDGIKAGDPFPAERKEQLLKQIDESVALLKANGLFSKCYLYGFDEISTESFAAMKDIFGEVKKRHPDLLTLTTGYDHSFGITSGVDGMDAWCPLTPRFDLKLVEEARARGKQVWWYTCIGPQAPYANWFVEYDAIDARVLMGLQTAKYRPDGYLYYAMMRWPLTTKPISFGPYTDWPPASFHEANGDGSIICAGPHGPVPTIRLENIRDGIEDYEYFWLLEQEINRLKKRSGPAASKALAQAEKAAQIGDEVVVSLSNFTKSPDALRAKRRQVAEAIIAARKVNK